MTQSAAPMSLAIKIVTGFVLAATIACIVGSLHTPALAVGATILMLVSVICYLTAPTGYELTDGRLRVFTHIGSRVFGPVTGCSRVQASLLWGLRLFGNGGLFAGTGFYWSPRLGVYRAYVTSARRPDMLLIQTPSRNVLITPEDPEAFLASCANANAR